jgi:hypothetical protein
MRKTLAIAGSLAVLMFGISALWGKGGKEQPKTTTQATYLGPISCTVTTFKEAPQIPVGNVPLQDAGNNGAPQNGAKNAAAGNNATPQPPGNHGGVQNPGNNADPQNPVDNGIAHAPDPYALPQSPGGDAIPPNPAQNLSPSLSKPIATLTDCLAHGGQVVILPDGTVQPIVIENPDAIRGHEWHRLSLSGYMKGAVLHIISVRII